MRRFRISPEWVAAGLLVIAFGAGALESPYFLDINYLLDRTTLFAETGLLVLGMTFVIICGEIDLSVASALALAACVAGRVAEHASPVAAAAAGIATGVALGAFNGVLVAYAKLPSILVTLATLAFFRGIAQAMLGPVSVQIPKAVIGVNELYTPYPVPLTLVLFLALAAILGFVLHRSVFGRWVFAAGANDQAASYSAVPVAPVKFWVFVLSGFLAGLGGILMDSRLGVARYDHAAGFELDVITATVLGGTSIYGGKGSIAGAVLAFFLIYFVRTGLGLANITAEFQMTIVGALLIVAVGLHRLARA